ncbi:hypothetical protein [Streptomyces vietnamensis]|uniref:hypothetical protein n=1 Tax=Streptomyces vietnamensis TaxID=362257 RepID=UPI00341B74D3
MVLDLRRQFSTGQRVALVVVGFAAASLGFGFELSKDAVTALTIAGVTWSSLMVLVTVPVALGRRLAVRSAALLEAAGYTPVPDRNGRPRYLPPGGRLPGHGNPFAG